MNPIITPNQYQALTNIKVPDEDQEYIENLIKVISDMIEGFIGYDLEEQPRFEQICKNIKVPRIWVAYPPLKSVQYVVINGQTIESENYIFDEKKIQFTNYFCTYLSGCNCTYTFDDVIKLNYLSGYAFGDDGNVPYDIQYAVAMMIQALMMIQEDPDSMKYSNYKINDISYAYKDLKESFNSYLIPLLTRILM